MRKHNTNGKERKREAWEKEVSGAVEMMGRRQSEVGVSCQAG